MAEALANRREESYLDLDSEIFKSFRVQKLQALLDMAVPADKTIHNLSGQWKFNHVLSDDISPAMAVQGVNIIVRTALSRAPISLSISHTKDVATGVESLSTRQNTIGRVMEEQRAIDGEEVATSHIIFGEVKSKVRFAAVGEIANELLRLGWEEDTEELIEVQSQGSGWISWQAWGFGLIDGKRYHIRRAVLQKGSGFEEVAPDHVAVRMVYDWVN